MTNDTQITTAVSNDLAWLKHHLLSLALVGALSLITIFGVLTYVSKVRHEDFLQNQALLSQMVKQNDQTQAQNAQNLAQSKAQIDALTTQNASIQQQLSVLTAAIAARDAQLLKDREQIKTLPPPQLATKWGEAANEPAPVIDASGNFLAPLPLAQKSADALIQVPVLQKDNADLSKQIDEVTAVGANNQKMYEAEKVALTSETAAHASDNAVCKQTVETKDSQIKDLKASATKWHIIVAVIGAAFGYAAHR